MSNTVPSVSSIFLSVTPARQKAEKTKGQKKKEKKKNSTAVDVRHMYKQALQIIGVIRTYQRILEGKSMKSSVAPQLPHLRNAASVSTPSETFSHSER